MSKLRKINVSEVEGNEDSIFSPGTIWFNEQNSLRISDGVTEGGVAVIEGQGEESVVYPTAGDGTAGIIFPNDPEGGSGDAASIKWYGVDGEQMRLHVKVRNDSDDEILIDASGPVKIQTAGGTEGEKLWTFDTDGNLMVPSATIDLENPENSILPSIIFPIPQFDGTGSVGVGTTGFVVKALDSNWTFTPGGEPSLTLPSGGVIRETVVTENPTIELEPADAEAASQKLIIKGGAVEDYHLHLTTGDLDETAIFLGTDDHHVKVGGITGVSLKAKIDSYIFLTTSDDSDNPDKYYFGLQPDGMLVVDGLLIKPTVPPLSSTGQVGDRQGMFAFSDSHFYYCTQNYSDGYQAVLVSGYSGAAFPSLLKGEYPEPQVGWTFVWNSVTYTIVNVSDPNEGEWQLQVDQTIDTGEGGTVTLYPPPAHIWKRVAWINETWGD